MDGKDDPQRTKPSLLYKKILGIDLIWQSPVTTKKANPSLLLNASYSLKPMDENLG
jgi:hypothetical protein